MKNTCIMKSTFKKKSGKQNSEYLKLFNNHFSNRINYSKFFKKLKLKNSSISSTKRKNNSELLKSIQKENINQIKISFNLKQYNNYKNNTYQHDTNNNINKKKKVFTQLLKAQNKSDNFIVNESIIKKQNKDLLYARIMNNTNDNNNNITFKNIIILWDSLCVPTSYRNLFKSIMKHLDKEDKNKLIFNEYNELNELKIELELLIKSIKERKNILNELKWMNDELKLIFGDEGKKSNEILVNKMSKYIEKLRNVTINICFTMNKIKNKIYSGNIAGKFFIDLIAEKYQFDKNYLIKMKEEMAFLKEGNAKYFFNVSEDHTPFLIKASEVDINVKDPFIHIVPITEDISSNIDRANYIIYQELISYQNSNYQNNIFRPISPQNIFNDFFNKKDKVNKNNEFKLFENNLHLEKGNKIIKRIIPQTKLSNNYPKIQRNINMNNENSIATSNSCINFDIKKNEFNNNKFFMNVDKIKNCKMFDSPNNNINNMKE